MSDEPVYSIHIDKFNVSEECRKSLKQVGFTYAEEIAEFLLNNLGKGAMINARWVKYYKEIVQQLDLLGLWSEPTDH